MKKIRLLAPLAMVVAMIGLSACGGGGDDAGAPLEAVTEGLTLREGAASAAGFNGTYAFDPLEPDAAASGGIEIRSEGTNDLLLLPGDEPTATMLAVLSEPLGGDDRRLINLHVDVGPTGLIRKVVAFLIPDDPLPFVYVGCGTDLGFACTGVSVNQNNNTITLRSVVLKELSTTDDANIGQVLPNATTSIKGSGLIRFTP